MLVGYIEYVVYQCQNEIKQVTYCFYFALQRHTDWEAAAGLLKGIYETLARYPYIVHMQHLKTLINACQVILEGHLFVSVLQDVVVCFPLMEKHIMSMLAQ
jgi:hypothetical protein